MPIIRICSYMYMGLTCGNNLKKYGAHILCDDISKK